MGAQGSKRKTDTLSTDKNQETDTFSTDKNHGTEREKDEEKEVVQ